MGLRAPSDGGKAHFLFLYIYIYNIVCMYSCELYPSVFTITPPRVRLGHAQDATLTPDTSFEEYSVLQYSTRVLCNID
jgi:hypothetical protein